jgi:hypothetical protein
MSDDEIIRAIVCATGRAFLPRLPERRWFFHRRKYANDIRCAPARHVRLVTVAVT